jgi:hypothetical protein
MISFRFYFVWLLERDMTEAGILMRLSDLNAILFTADDDLNLDNYKPCGYFP